MREGDLVFFHGPNFFSRLIRFGQGLRFRGDRRKYAYWNHVGVIVEIGENGPVIVEAVKNVQRNILWENYSELDYVVKIVSPDLNRIDRKEVVEYCERQVGDSYDWVEIVSIGINCIFGGSISIKFSTSHICSGLAGEALERAGFDFGRTAADLMPADLAEYFDVTVDFA
jgi:uncharacterized protein YycO